MKQFWNELDERIYKSKRITYRNNLVSVLYELDDLDDRDWIPGRVRDSCLFATAFRPALEPTEPHIHWMPGMKRSRREADYSLPSSAEV
jgi:hypothetical protein